MVCESVEEASGSQRSGMKECGEGQTLGLCITALRAAIVTVYDGG